jgi:glycosyltransferase involved in cell wall biosynthesis
LRSKLDSVHSAFPKRFHLLGARRDIPAVMTAMDLLTVPSEWEPFGIVCIEAMSAGKAVIAYDVDGIPEVVQRERTGFLVSAHDSQAFAACVLRVVDDAALRHRLGEAGRVRARDRFDARTMVRALESIYVKG